MKPVPNTDPQPPRIATWWLRTYCKPELAEDLEGDLYEYFLRNKEQKGIQLARLIYYLDVLKFMRLYTIQKPKFIQLLIHWIMLHSYIKTSGRSLMRSKMFSAINIIGLAASMSAGMLMISLLSDLTSYDQHHKEAHQIYRLTSDLSRQGGSPEGFASTSVRAGRLVDNEISGIDELTILSRGFGGDAQHGNKIIPLTGIYAQPSFFGVFSFPLLEGDPETALKEPYSIVLTEKTARKFFGNESAINQALVLDSTQYVVTGVMEDLPKFSHIQFESLVSFSTTEILNAENDNFESWSNMRSNYVYLRLNSGVEPDQLQEGLNRIADRENADFDNEKVYLGLQPMTDIILGEDLSNQIGMTLPVTLIHVILGLAIIVMLSACFNYTNLSIARAMRRSREVGIRKVIGAHRFHVIGQFLTESILLSLIAMVLGIILFGLIRPHFLSLDNSISELADMRFSPELLGYFVVLALAVGTLAGILPALFFSRIRIMDVLKDTSRLKIFQHLTMKRVLLVAQYAFSLIFITSALIVYSQYKSFLAVDLGFQTENILNIRLQGNDGDQVLNQMKTLSEVEDGSVSMMVTSVGSAWHTFIRYQHEDDSIQTLFNGIDENYLRIHGHSMLAGRNFTYSTESAEEDEVIVTEAVLRSLDINDPEAAIGEVIRLDGKDLQIIGVLKDFNYRRADQEIEPVVFRYKPGNMHWINLKVRTTDPIVMMERVEKAWQKIDPVHPLEATFYEDQIQQAFAEFTVMVKIVGFLSFLSVCISSMGLLGMVVFTTETRIREISIRKVLGANTPELLVTLGRNFVLLLLLAAVIALPLTYLLFDKVVLAGFANRAPIGAFEMLTGLAGVLFIALGLIFVQAMQVIRRNPAEVLKAE